jgi:hypothetical protein
MTHYLDPLCHTGLLTRINGRREPQGSTRQYQAIVKTPAKLFVYPVLSVIALFVVIVV